MNERIKEHARQAVEETHSLMIMEYKIFESKLYEKLAEMIVEATLDQVKERAYNTCDRDWSDSVDRPWIQLEFGYGPLHDAKGVEE